MSLDDGIRSDINDTIDEEDNTRSLLWKVLLDPVLPEEQDRLDAADLLLPISNPWLHDVDGNYITHCLHYMRYVSLNDRKDLEVAHLIQLSDFSWETVKALCGKLELAQRRWEPQMHSWFPDDFKEAVFTLLLILKRVARLYIPRDVRILLIKAFADEYGRFERLEPEDYPNLNNLLTSTLRIMCAERGYFDDRERWPGCRWGKHQFIKHLKNKG